MGFVIAEAFVDLSLQGAEKVKQGLGGVKGMLGQLGITPATLGIVGIGAAIGFAVKKAIDWEAHNEELKGKLAAMGENAELAAGRIDHLGKAIATVTTMSGGQVKALVMQGMNLGLTSEQAQQFATISIGAAKATGKSAEEIMEGAVKMAHGMRNGLERSVPAIASAGTQSGKLAALSKLAGQGFQQLEGETKTTKGTMENFSKTVGALYTDLGKVFLPVVKAVVGVFQEVVDWIKAMIDTITEFAGASGEAGGEFQSVWAEVSDFFATCAKYIGSICTWIVKQFAMIPAYGAWMGVFFANLFMNLIPSYLRAFGQNFVILCQWLWTNWKDIFATIWNYIKAGFTNTIDNIKSLWNALWGFFKGKGWHVEWKGLTDGAVSEIKKMPQFVKVQTDPIWDQIKKEADDRLTKTGESFDAIAEKHRPTAAKKEAAQKQAKTEIGQIVADGLKPLENINEKGKGGGFSGVMEIWKSAQTNLMKGNLDKERLAVAKQQLAETKGTNATLRQMAGRRSGPALSLAH